MFAQPLLAQPLASRMRPRTLEEFVGQEHLLGPEQGAAHDHRERRGVLHDLLGPAGRGQDHAGAHQSPTARSRTSSTSRPSTSGIKEIRAVMEQAQSARAFGERTILLCGRDPSLQQSPAGRVFALCGKGQHHPDRRHHGKPVVRDQRGPSVALQRCFVLHALQADELCALMRRALFGRARLRRPARGDRGRAFAHDREIFKRRRAQRAEHSWRWRC